MNKKTELFLYTSEECSLCRSFKDGLDRQGLEYQQIDVASDPELVQRYAARVPVLVSGNTEICEGLFDAKRIDEFLGDTRH